MEGIDWSRVINIVVGLVALISGWALGFFDSKMRADKKINQANEKAEAAIRQAKGEADRAVMAARAAAESAKPALPGTTLLRLWLDSAERPSLDLDGQRVETSTISEPNRKRLITLLNVMRPWIEGKSAAPVAPPAAAQVPAPANPVPQIVTPVAAPFDPAPPSGSSQGKPAPSVAPAPTVKKDEKPVAPLSIVAQIDEILQARLAVTPLAKRGIRLQESPEGGVIVWVGIQKFAGVGDVTDPEVQAIIHAATSEWERKYTPGL